MAKLLFSDVRANQILDYDTSRSRDKIHSLFSLLNFDARCNGFSWVALIHLPFRKLAKHVNSHSESLQLFSAWGAISIICLNLLFH